MSLGSSVSTVTELRTGWPGFNSGQRQGLFLFAAASGSALGPTQPSVKWLPGALSLWVKWPGREADHSASTSAEVKNASLPICRYGVVLN